MSLDFDLIDGTVDLDLSIDGSLPDNPRRPLWKTVLWTTVMILVGLPLAALGLFGLLLLLGSLVG